MFGFPAYAHVDDGKLEPKANKCIFLGYATGVKGYCIWCIEEGKTPKFVISKNVTFYEPVMCNQIGGDTSVEGMISLLVRRWWL